MTAIQLFAFFILPVVIVAMAFAVYALEGRSARRRRQPDLFDDKHSIGTPGE